MKACSERGGRGWWTGQSWLEAPLVSVCAGAAFSHSDTKAATDALHTLCFCPWTVCSRWRPKKATASVTWPGSDTFSFWQTNIFFSNKKSYCFNFPRSSPGIFFIYFIFYYSLSDIFLWGGGRGGGIFISTDNRKRKPDIYLSTRPLAPQRERKGDAKMKRNKKVSVSGFRLACERWKGRRLSPEIIDVQTNRRCGRTREFGRLLKNESKREEGGREVNGWRWWDKGGRKVMRWDEEESGESWRGGFLSFS